ncbi:MAG: hypothetical protein M3R72_10295 [Bacteroidota bacterium]|nr:hypothetical protein [Bacteroidota bacterium]
MTARECAKDLIRHYVLRGDTVNDLANGGLGSYNDQYSACIGGAIWNNFQREGQKVIYLKRYQIGIEKIGEEEVLKIFSLLEVYNEIINERDYGKQVTLDL